MTHQPAEVVNLPCKHRGASTFGTKMRSRIRDTLDKYDKPHQKELMATLADELTNDVRFDGATLPERLELLKEHQVRVTIRKKIATCRECEQKTLSRMSQQEMIDQIESGAGRPVTAKDFKDIIGVISKQTLELQHVAIETLCENFPDINPSVLLSWYSEELANA